MRLPTLEEWKKAAGPELYPWGKKFDPTFANTKESDLGQTTPVDMYADGATPDGVCDMAGNVWDWTRTLDESLSFEAYVLAGGSWWNAGGSVGSAARLGRGPRFSYYNFGVRVVVVPISRSG